MLLNVAENDITYKCLICNKIYKDRTGLYRHKKTHPNYEEVSKLKFDYKEKYEKLQEEINQLKNITRIGYVSKNNVSNIINNGTINNNTQHVNIIQFGKEDFEKISAVEVNDILFKLNNSPLLKSIEYTNFNDRIPEQKNIKCSNINSKYIDIYNGNRWIKQLAESVLDSLYLKHSSNIEHLSEQCENKTKINKSIMNELELYNTYDNLYSNDKLKKIKE